MPKYSLPSIEALGSRNVTSSGWTCLQWASKNFKQEGNFL